MLFRWSLNKCVLSSHSRPPKTILHIWNPNLSSSRRVSCVGHGTVGRSSSSCSSGFNLPPQHTRSTKTETGDQPPSGLPTQMPPNLKHKRALSHGRRCLTRRRAHPSVTPAQRGQRSCGRAAAAERRRRRPHRWCRFFCCLVWMMRSCFGLMMRG